MSTSLTSGLEEGFYRLFRITNLNTLPMFCSRKGTDSSQREDLLNRPTHLLRLKEGNLRKVTKKRSG